MKKTIALTLGAILLSLNQPTYAAIQYWDPDNNGANNNCSTGVGFGGATGNWSTAVSAWTSSGCGTGADVAWTEGNDANFWGTAGLAILSGPRTAGNLTFQTAGYTITNSTLTLSGAGKGVITLPGSGTTLITSGLLGTIGYGVVGPGILKMTNLSLNTITGPVSVTSSGVLELSVSGCIGGTGVGSGDITLNGGTYQDDTGTVDTVTTNRLFIIGANGGTINMPTSGAILIYAGRLTGTGNTLTVSGSSGADIRLQTNAFQATYGHNTFSKLVVDTALVTLGQSTVGGTDDTLGATPGSFTADAVTLKNGGKLRGNSYNFSLNANRGITINNGGSIGAISGFVLTVPQQITGSTLLKINENAASQDTGAVFFTADNSSTFTGKILVKGGTLNINADNNFGAVPGSVTPDAITLTNGSALAFNQTMTIPANRGITIGAGSSGLLASLTGFTGTISSVVTGSGALTKTSATGSVVLNGANTYTGKTTVSGGSLSVSSLNKVSGGSASSSLGAPTTVANGTIALGSTTVAGTLIYTGSGETSDRVIDLAGTTGGATVQADGSGALVLSAVNTATGAGAKTLTLTGGSTANNSIGKIVDSTSATSITKTGAGTWTLSGANAHTGTTTMSSGGGLLNIGNAGALSTGALVAGGNSTFDNTTGSDLTVANAFTLSGGSPTYIGSANNMTINGAVTISSAARTITVNAHTLTLGHANGISQDSARNFTKAGNGTLVISGTSSYTGTTTVSAGTLRIDGSIATSSAVTVSAAGTLAGNGTVPAVTVTGTISPGASPGTLTTGAETWPGGGSYVWEINDFNGSIGSAYDTINATSANITATTGSKFNIKVTSLSGTSAGQAANFSGTTDYDFTILHTTSGITGNGVGAINVDVSAFQNALGNGGFFFVSIVGNDLVLSYRRAAFITSNPSSLALNTGSTANFSGSASGSGTVTYQWKKGASALSNGSQAGNSIVFGTTTAALTITGVTYQDEGAYTLVATGTYGAAATTTAATLTVSDPPVITSPTTSSTITTNAAETVHLAVASTGRPGTYQWKKGGVNLANGEFANAATVSGAQSASLTLVGVYVADAGAYTVALTNSDGTADTSAAATALVVNDPVFTSDLATNQSFNCGVSNALSVTVAGSSNLVYQWFLGDFNSSTAITDATNTALAFLSPHAMDAGSYFVIVTNGLGNSITSVVSTVTVVDTLAPAITQNVGVSTVECHTSYTDPGATATDACEGSVSITTTGTVNTNAPGIYTITYTASDSVPNTATSYRVVTVSDSIAPVVTINPGATTVECHTSFSNPGATASDSCDASVTTGSLSGSVDVNTPGVYTLTYSATDASGNTGSATRTVTVSDNTAPVVTINPGATTVECHSSFNNPGATASDTCDASVTTATLTGSVDANTPGIYTLTYSATDASGNTGTATRVVTVSDNTAPVVTINPGATTVECHSNFSNPGATASDACDASVTTATLTGSVDADTPGSYTLTYSATDATGHTGTATRVVTVSDNSAPVVTINPGATTVECHTSFSNPGATASDACDAGVTTATLSGSVNANTPGTYTLTYSATDASGSTGSATRVVTVSDSTAPVVMISGSNPITLNCHDSFSAPGATASDTCDAGVTTATVTSGSVNPNVGGTYTLTYSATDASGNTGTSTLVVNVVDTTPPNITLTGTNSMTVECHTAYTELGATATDACAGDIFATASIVITGSVDTNTVGSYTLTYTASDNINTATTTRVVQITDTTAPVVTINAGATTVECHTSFSNPGATASDSCDAGVTTATLFGSVNVNTPGTYTLTYSATDASGNTGTATRVVNVSDNTAPVVTINPGATTVECHASYTDAGATAADTCDVSPSVGTTGTVDVNTAGSYTLTYTATDASGNSSTATRVVTVQDLTPPVVTINGSSPVSIECHGSFSDPGATASDVCSGDVSGSIVVSGSVNANLPGSYTLTYTASDATGNTSSATRTVTVSDTAAPAITLNGTPSMTVECHGSFSDPGATANDACEGPASVNTTGSVDANTVGNYTLTYAACDSGSHCAASTRIVHVVDTMAPVVTLNGTTPMPVECHGSFSDPGATATDDCDASPGIVTSGSVNANLVGSYTLTYTATDANNNSGTATRVVNVTDTVAPVITVTGGDQTVECHGSFTDSGATANDACEGDLSANITVSGTVNTNAVGVYTLTYSVGDSSSNNSSATRVVTVNDTAAPVITVPGSNPDSACQFVTYNDPGATANDACAGSVSVSSSGSVDSSTAGAYTLTYSATDGNGNTATATRVVNVTPCNATITQQPLSTNVNANASFTLSVTAVSGNPITYQWSKNGTNIVNATDATFTVAHAFRTNAGTYTVDVASGPTTITSSNAVVTVNDPVFTTNPASVTVSVGIDKKVTFLAVADGTPSLRYQWYFKTATRTNKLTTSTSLSVNVTLGAAGSYYCVVTNIGHSITATSEVAALQIYQAPKFTKQPAPNNSKFVGQTLVLSVAVGPAQANQVQYGGPVVYQWVRGNPPPGISTVIAEDARHIGTQTPTLTILNIDSTDQALLNDAIAYRCIATNAAPTNVFSHAALLTVKDYTNPPVVVIVKSNNNAIVTTTNQIYMSGTATDKGNITNVSLRQITVDATNDLTSDITYKQNGMHQDLPGNVLWTNFVTLTPGTNAFTASATDTEGNVGASKPVRNIFYLVPQALTLTTNGHGTIQITSLGTLGKPGTTNVNQGIGYTLKAVGTPPHTFHNWTDGDGNPYSGNGTSDTNQTLHFIMPGTNLTLHANFN